MARKYVRTLANGMSPAFFGVDVEGVFVSEIDRYRYVNATEVHELLAMSKDMVDYRFEQENGRVWFASTKFGYGYCRVGDFLFMTKDGCVTSVDRSLVQNYLNRRVYVVIGELDDSN